MLCFVGESTSELDKRLMTAYSVANQMANLMVLMLTWNIQMIVSPGLNELVALCRNLEVRFSTVPCHEHHYLFPPTKQHFASQRNAKGDEILQASRKLMSHVDTSVLQSCQVC